MEKVVRNWAENGQVGYKKIGKVETNLALNYAIMYAGNVVRKQARECSEKQQRTIGKNYATDLVRNQSIS